MLLLYSPIEAIDPPLRKFIMSQNPFDSRNPENAENLPNSASQNHADSQRSADFAQNNGTIPAAGAPYDASQKAHQAPQFNGENDSYAPQGEELKKKKTGLILGLLLGLLLLLALLALALWFFLGRGDKVKDVDELKAAMDKSVSGTATDKCNVISDTILKETMQEDLQKNNVDPANVYLCSDVDFTSIESLMASAATQEEEPKMVMGVYTGDQKADTENNLLKDLENEGVSDGWAVRGDNWGIIGNTDESVKTKLMDELGGEEIKK